MDRRTDRQVCRGYYSGLHCKQCGRAVKTTNSAVRLEILELLKTVVHYSTLSYSKIMGALRQVQGGARAPPGF